MQVKRTSNFGHAWAQGTPAPESKLSAAVGARGICGFCEAIHTDGAMTHWRLLIRGPVRTRNRSRSFASAIRHASRYRIGAMPTARPKRSKNVERERAASFASSPTVQACSGRSCSPWIAAARRQSASPRTRPGDAFVPPVDRSAYMNSTSSSRASTTQRRIAAHETGQKLGERHVALQRQQKARRRTCQALADPELLFPQSG